MNKKEYSAPVVLVSTSVIKISQIAADWYDREYYSIVLIRDYTENAEKREERKRRGVAILVDFLDNITSSTHVAIGGLNMYVDRSIQDFNVLLAAHNCNKRVVITASPLWMLRDVTLSDLM